MVGFSFLFNACVKKEFTEPESTCDDQNYTITHTIAQLKTLFTGDTLRITEDIIIQGTVTSTDQYGNFYKEIVIQDSTDALCIMADASYMYTKFPVGQKIYIKCKDLYLGKSYDVVKLGSTYMEYGIKYFGRIQGQAFIDDHFIKSCDNNPLEPELITLADIGPFYVYKLVKIENVQFKGEELNSTYADVTNLESINHNIIDEDNNTLIVRTSGYAAFAGDSLPKGSGTIIGILGKYNDDYQFYVRKIDEVDFSQERFAEAIFKDFEDEDLYSGGWEVYTVIGVSWGIDYYSGNNFANCSNYNYDTGENEETETWLISPELDLSAFTNPFISFETACNYSGSLLQVKYSADYTGEGDPNNATWSNLAPSLSPGSWNWVNSGNLNLQENTKYVAFVYYGTNTSGKTWEVDDILIDENAKK